MFELLVLTILPIAGQGVLQLLFAGRLAGVRLRAWQVVLYLCLLGILQGLPLPDNSGTLAIAGETLVLWGMIHFGMRCRTGTAWVAALLGVYIAQLSFGIFNALEMLFLSPIVGTAALYPLLFLAVLGELIFCGGCYGLVLRLLSLENGVQQPYIGLLLLPGFFLFAAELYILYTAYTNISTTAAPGKHLLLLVLQILGLGVLLCTFYAYRRVCHGLQAQQALQTLAQAAQAQKDYVAEASLRYQKTTAFRHDIKNHLSVLDGLLSAGMTEEARAYLGKLDRSAASLSFPFQSGVAAVDILLGEKLALAQENDIQIEISLALPQEGTVNALDWCVIFANALDNAIQACLKLEQERWLHLRGERQGAFYRLSFENSAAPGPLPPMGIGLSNVKAVAERYHGAVLTEKDGSVFRLHVLVNSSAHPDDNSRHLH